MPQRTPESAPERSAPVRSVRPQSGGRRRAILDAAIRVIADGGVDSLTHRRVAAAATVPLGSTTYYFSSREELIQEAFRFYLDEAALLLDQLARSHRERSAEGLVGYLLEVVRREFSDPGRVRAEYELIVAASRDPELARELEAWERTQIGLLAEWLEGLGARRPVDAARTVLHLMRGFELERLTRPDTPLEDLARRLRVVVRAWIDVDEAQQPH